MTRWTRITQSRGHTYASCGMKALALFWASDGLLPDDPEWLRRALDLSDSLVADLLTWLSDMTALHFGSSVADWHELRRQPDERGRQLAERLQAEVGTRYKVRYQA
jgi:hypothetical protein